MSILPCQRAESRQRLDIPPLWQPDDGLTAEFLKRPYSYVTQVPLQGADTLVTDLTPGRQLLQSVREGVQAVLVQCGERAYIIGAVVRGDSGVELV